MKLTLEQIEQFLSTKQDTDIIGRGCDTFGCLVANTLNFVHPDLLWSVGATDAYGIPDMESDSEVTEQVIHFSDEIADLIIKFDTIAAEEPVTKAEWRTACRQ